MCQVKFTVYIASSAERGLSWLDRKLHVLYILDYSDKVTVPGSKINPSVKRQELLQE